MAVFVACLVVIWAHNTYSDIRQANARGVEYVRKHYEPSPAFYALNPDLPTGSWDASSNFMHCLRYDDNSSERHCADVRYSFNVMQGAEVKRVVCVWQVQVSAGEVTSAIPDNTEARQLFQKSAP